MNARQELCLCSLTYPYTLEHNGFLLISVLPVISVGNLIVMELSQTTLIWVTLEQRASSMELPSPGSKRARPPSSCGSQEVSCLVDGCSSDLSKCRDYHRRHKVCELHSKTAKVTLGGQDQRFCQQCSRFHSLVEFDDGKRSCRKRLEGHNQRRRRPQPESLAVNPGNFLSSDQGSRFFPFSSPTMMPPTSALCYTRSRPIKPKTDPPSLNGSSHLPASSSNPCTFGGRWFPLLQVSGSHLPRSSSFTHPSLRDLGSVPGSPGGSSSSTTTNDPEIFCNGLTHVVTESDRAHSLLSSLPAASDASAIGLSRMMHQPSHPTAPAGQMTYGMYYGSVGDHQGRANLHCQDVFQADCDVPSSIGPHQTLTFSWE
ncbi:hypothetical protein Nepgr_016947 [Nepenthes gracilis]|uniref:SBP-type domain-containing protein n=1 Tax=Nepenthes gracilis TaxID=150966 RepID=A0AAD3XSU4_NEPGR|nr:hypothetical protein Nepgr_016947 [Nepenthes gracilis]